MDILGQSALLTAITSFGLGVSILAKNRRNTLFLAFAILSALISAWSLTFFLEIVFAGETFYRQHLLFTAWLAPACLGFIRFLVRIQDNRFSRRLFEASLFFALAYTFALFLYFDDIAWVRDLVHVSRGLIMVQILQLMWLDRRVRREVRIFARAPTVGLGRRNLIYIGALAVVFGATMDHVPWLGRGIPSIMNLAVTGYLFFISEAISQQRLLNFGALASRVLVLLAVALILTGIYSLLVAWIQDSPGLFFLNSFIVSFLVVTLLEPLRTLMRYFTQRLLTQKHLRIEQILRDAQRRLAGIVDLGGFFQAVLQTVEQTIQPQWAALYILRSDGTKYRRVRTIGTENAVDTPQPLREVIVNHPILHHCELLRKRGDLPVLLDQVLENEIDRSASRVEREHLTGLIQGLKALGGNILIPLFESGKILGFVTANVQGPPEPWGSNWGLLPIVYPYFEQAAQTLRSMEVYVRQREKERLATLGEMAAGLAHEIRNPLGAIKGAAQFLDPSSDRPESRFLRIIIEEVDRLNRVVTQFLEYSKPSALELHKINPSVLAAKAVEHLRPGLRQGIAIDFWPSPILSHVMAAPEQIHQVVLNLVQNAVKALEGRAQGHVKVSVESLAGDDPAQGEVAIVVEDDGPGIKREHLDKLFIPFFTTSPSGTGLGLSICQKIVEAHRGRIEVASEEGRFARFTVWLPRAPESKES